MALHRHTHDVAPRDTLDRAAFIVAFLLGVGGGVLLKALEAHPLVSAGFSALILLLYAIAAWAGGRIKIEPETIGDNCYYLGFLFTLASLSYTLYQMSDPSLNGGRPVDIPVVISGFGVALSSTIFGVFFRVLLMQLRPDFVAKDREVRADLNRAFGEFRKNMSRMLSQMKAFSAESVQLASERDERIRSATEKFVDEHQQSLQATADFLATHMKEAFSEAAQKAVGDISAALVESQRTHQERMDESLQELQKIKNRLSEQEAEAYQDIQARRKRMADNLEEAEKILKAHREEIKASSRAMRSASDAIEKRLIPALDALEKRTSVVIPVQDATFEEGVVDDAKPPSNLRMHGSWRTRSGGTD